jgi:hypothetical protein
MVGTDGATDHAREIRWRSVSGHATDAERGMSMSNAGDSKWRSIQEMTGTQTASPNADIILLAASKGSGRSKPWSLAYSTGLIHHIRNSL